MKDYDLDKEERELLSSIERGEWQPVKHMKSQIDKYVKYAKNSLKKDQRISLRMSKQDLIGIKIKAGDEGSPY